MGREGPLEKEMAALSSVLAWETPWTEEPGARVRHGRAHTHRALGKADEQSRL